MTSLELVEINVIMICFLGVRMTLDNYCLIVEHLAIPQLPISKKYHENWGVLENLQGSLIEFVVHEWRLPIVVSK